MPIIVGYIAAIISMLGWGSQFVPMKKIKEYNPFFYQLVMCIGILLFGIAVTIFTQEFSISFLAIISGIIWATGSVFAIFAIKNSRLAIAVPVWMSVVIFSSFIWGIFFFREPVQSIILGLSGIIFLIVGIILISRTGQDKQNSNAKGIVFAFIAGLFFGSYIVPYKLSGLPPLSFLFPMSIGVFIGGVIPFFIARPKIDKRIFLPAIISGVLWNIASVSSFFAVGILGIAIGFPLTQMALFVSVLWGLFYFHEIKGRDNLIKVFVSSIILFIGAIFLSFSK